MSVDEGQADQRRLLLLRKSSFSVMHAITTAILGTASLVLIARNLGAEILGLVGFSLSLFGLISFLSDFGIGSVHRRMVSEAESPARAIGAYAVIRLASLALMVFIGIVMYLLWSRGILSGAMEPSPIISASLIVFLAYYAMLGLGQIMTHTFEALENVVKSQFPEILDLIVRVALLVFIVVNFSFSSMSIILVAFAYLLGATASFAITLFLFQRVRVDLPDLGILKRYFSALSPIVIVSVAITLMSFIDKVFIGYFVGARELGLYFGAQNLIVFVTTFSLGIAILILPSVTTYTSRRDPLASWEIIMLAERYVSIVVFPAAAFYIILRSQILGAFLGAEFVHAADMMTVLVVSATFASFVFPLRAILAAENRARTIFQIGIATVAVTLLLLILLVPTSILGVRMLGLGGFGAALSILGGTVVSFVGNRWMAWREVAALPSSRSIVHILCAGAMAGAIYVIDLKVVHSQEWWQIILLAIVAAAIYGILVRLAGELEVREIRYFARLLRLKENIAYATKELLGR